MSGRSWGQKRLAGLMKIHKGQCIYCKCPVVVRSYKDRREDNATIDHIIPKSHGGGDGWKNLTLSCLACNESKGDGPAAMGMPKSHDPN